MSPPSRVARGVGAYPLLEDSGHENDHNVEDEKDANARQHPLCSVHPLVHLPLPFVAPVNCLSRLLPDRSASAIPRTNRLYALMFVQGTNGDYFSRI